MSKYLSRDYLRKLDPAVFEDAAAIIKRGGREYSCLAIGTVIDQWEDTEYTRAYRAAFGPKSEKEEQTHPFWNKDSWSKRTLQRRSRERIQALLMMAAMVRYAKEH